MLKKIVVLVLLSSVLVSCNLLFDVARKQFTVNLDPKEVTIARGESAEIEVTITPFTGVDLSLEEATVSLVSPPDGVTADKLVMPGNIRTRTLTLRIASSTELMEDEELTIEVNKGGIGNDSKLKLTVTN
jgi:hypothetical protein